MLVTALARLLVEATGEHDLIFGTTWAGRHAPESPRMLGVFVNPLPLRLDLRKARTLSDVFEVVQGNLVDIAGHQDYCIIDMIKHVEPFVGKPVMLRGTFTCCFRVFPSRASGGVRSYQLIDFQDVGVSLPYGLTAPPERLMFEFEPVVMLRPEGDLSINFGFMPARFSETQMRGLLARVPGDPLRDRERPSDVAGETTNRADALGSSTGRRGAAAWDARYPAESTGAGVSSSSGHLGPRPGADLRRGGPNRRTCGGEAAECGVAAGARVGLSGSRNSLLLAALYGVFRAGAAAVVIGAGSRTR